MPPRKKTTTLEEEAKEYTSQKKKLPPPTPLSTRGLYIGLMAAAYTIVSGGRAPLADIKASATEAADFLLE